MKSATLIVYILLSGILSYGQGVKEMDNPNGKNPANFLQQDSLPQIILPETDIFLEDHGWRSGRIVGGEDAVIEDYPWQVAILTSGNQQFCGGSIIDEHWVLTAAHCLGIYSNIKVRAGVTDKTDVGQTIAVQMEISHPLYQSVNEYNNDIALLYLSAPLDLSGDKAQAVPILTQVLAGEGYADAGVMSVITGWGALSYGGSGTNILQVAQVPITNNIGSYSPSMITPDMLLAGFEEGGADACQGDSGGPLVVPDGNGGYFLAGITSWGNGCAFEDYPGVYARVSTFEDWIRQYVPLTSPEAPGYATQLSVKTDHAGALQAAVSWINPTETFEGNELTDLDEIHLYRNTELIYTLDDPGIGALVSFLDETVPLAGLYNYSVKGVNASGEGSAVMVYVYIGEAGVLIKEPFDYEAGQLPRGWLRTGGAGHNWYISNTSVAGGNAPELSMYWDPPATGVSRVVSYPIALSGQEELQFKFNQHLRNWPGANEGEIAAIDISFDEGNSWSTIWQQIVSSDIPQAQYDVTFSVPSDATILHLGVRFEGNSYNINDWFLDDMVLEFEPQTMRELQLTLFLEGPYTFDADNPMHTGLLEGGLLPLSQPFGPPLPYFGNTQPGWYYTGDESVESMPVDAVDWVLLELRDAPSAAEADATTVVTRRAALLLNTGAVVGLDGLPPVFEQEIQQNLFVVIYHRNHLAVMSAQPLLFNDGTYSWNFTTGIQQAYQQGHKHLGDGIYGMYGGDGDGNGQVQTQDKNEVWNLQSGQSGYRAGDFDLNGQVQTQDKNEIWNPNSGVASQVP